MVLREGGSHFIFVATQACLGVLFAEQKKYVVQHMKKERQFLFSNAEWRITE